MEKGKTQLPQADIQAGIRKYRNNIELSGVATIIFGAWSVIKSVTASALQGESLRDYLGLTPGETAFDFVIALVAFFIFSALVMWVHIYIGRSAIKFSRGLSRKKAFLFWSAVLLILTVISIPFYFEDDTFLQTPGTVLASILLDVTQSFVFIDMLVSSVMLRSNEKKVAAES